MKTSELVLSIGLVPCAGVSLSFVYVRCCMINVHE